MAKIITRGGSKQMLSFPRSPHFPQVFSEISVSKAFLLLLEKKLAKHVKGYEKTLRSRCQNPLQLVQEQRG